VADQGGAHGSRPLKLEKVVKLVSDPFVVIMNNKISLNPRLHMNGVYTNFVSDELINDTSALLS
jgi:hypothetical protein